MLRTIPLPALQRLSALQALQVRKEAEKAMPAFRAKLQRDLMSLKNVSDEAEEKRALEVAAELRVAARDLQGQLARLRLPSVRRSENQRDRRNVRPFFERMEIGHHSRRSQFFLKTETLQKIK